MKNILILTSGKVSKVDNFKREGVTTASFNDVSFVSGSSELYINGIDINNFSVIYFRFVGKSLEIATLVANYAKENGIRIVDGIYENSNLLPISLGKTLELRVIDKQRIPIPLTMYGDFSKMKFPFIVKSTTGQKAKEVWLVNSKEELEKLRNDKFEKAKFYFAQELVPNARRIRVLVIGDKAVGAIVRQTKWNRDKTKETLNPVPSEISDLSIRVAKAVNLDIAGIDILENSVTKERFIIEANAAPSWKLINKYCGVRVEDEIIKYLQTKI